MDSVFRIPEINPDTKKKEEKPMKNPLATITEYRALKARHDAEEKLLDAMKAELSEYVRNAEKTVRTEKSDTLIVGQYTLIVGHKSRKGFYEKRLREERPDIVEQYGRITEYDDFTVR